MLAKLLLMTCLASSLFMTGLIWFVDRVHYPLFDRVGIDGFTRYHAEHSRRTTLVVIVPMLLELITSALLTWRRPEGSPWWLAWAGLAAAVATWATTAFLSVPSHEVLGRGFEARAHRRLIGTNTLRVVAWSAHSLILMTMTTRSLR